MAAAHVSSYASSHWEDDDNVWWMVSDDDDNEPEVWLVHDEDDDEPAEPSDTDEFNFSASLEAGEESGAAAVPAGAAAAAVRVVQAGAAAAQLTQQQLRAAYRRAKTPLRRTAAMSDLLEPIAVKPSKRILVDLMAAVMPPEVPLRAITLQCSNALGAFAPPVVLMKLARRLLRLHRRPNARPRQPRRCRPTDSINGIAAVAIEEALRELIEAEESDAVPPTAPALPAGGPAPNCVICMEHPGEHHCGDAAHGICAGCLRSYIQTSLNDHVDDARLMPCSVPDCGFQYNRDSVVAALGHVGLLRATWRARTAKATAFGRLLECGCGAVAAVDDLVQQGLKTVKCPGCPIDYCLSCRSPHALNPAVKVCEQSEEYSLAKFQVVRCPKCDSSVSRTSGCNHMICICQHEFCYVCLADWRLVEGRRPEFSHYACNDPNPKFHGRSDRNGL